MLHFLLGSVCFHKAALQIVLKLVYASHIWVKLSSYWLWVGITRGPTTFTFMHLADAFIQSNLQLANSGYKFFSLCVNRTHKLSRCKRNALPLSHRNTKITIWYYHDTYVTMQYYCNFNYIAIFWYIAIFSTANYVPKGKLWQHPF